MPIQDRDYYREQRRRRHRGRASADTTPPDRPRNAESGGSGNRPLPPGRGSRPSGRWRIVAILLVGCLIGGGIVYGITLYLGQNPAGRDIPIADAPSTPITATAPQVVLRFTPTAPPALLSAATTTLVATITPIPATATPVSAPGLTERESLVAAFAQCDGQYSGDEERFRAQAADTAIEEGRQSLDDIRDRVEQYCGGAFLAASQQLSAIVPTPSAPAAGLRPTPTATRNESTPTHAAPPTPVASASSLHLREKEYMLELINAERAKVSVEPVILGNNRAAQLHAEAAIANCFSAHWGVDGLKPYMRYSLAGGYQSNGENGSGLDYCISGSDGYRAISSIDQEIREAMDGWMNSSGHRRNILDQTHKMVNIGIAWDRYNTAMFQHFEGDYLEYDRLPTIANGVLSLSATTKNGVRFAGDQDLQIQIYYDPPPHVLSVGQLSRTYCYDGGLLVGTLRWPLTGGYYWPTDEFTYTNQSCPNPYDVPADTPAPRSYTEAHQIWQLAASQPRTQVTKVVPWITASRWTASGPNFATRADISDVLAKYGDGVYTITVWGPIDGEEQVISEFSIFHGVTPPVTYQPNER